MLHALILRIGFTSTMRHSQETNTRTLNRDNNLQLVSRIVERQRLLDLAANGYFFVIGRDQNRDERCISNFGPRSTKESREDSQEQRVPDIYVDQQGHGNQGQAAQEVRQVSE